MIPNDNCNVRCCLQSWEPLFVCSFLLSDKGTNVLFYHGVSKSWENTNMYVVDTFQSFAAIVRWW